MREAIAIDEDKEYHHLKSQNIENVVEKLGRDRFKDRKREAHSIYQNGS